MITEAEFAAQFPHNRTASGSYRVKIAEPYKRATVIVTFEAGRPSHSIESARGFAARGSLRAAWDWAGRYLKIID